MIADNPCGRRWCGGLISRLARDRSGNTLALVAASLLPLLGLIGGGVDMGRSYLVQSRLQQACDAGVLAARKALGSEVAVSGAVPADVVETGERFFNINFLDESYGTANREFEMMLETDYAISGSARVDVPTSIMGIFGFDKVPIAVMCEAQLSFANADVMMVLDVTGSMRHTNPGDSESRMETLKGVIRNFHAQLSSNQGGTTRFGFVPYATNVNVGHLLKDEWVVDDWTYQSREVAATTERTEPSTTTQNWQYVSGTRSNWTEVSSYPATYVDGSNSDVGGSYQCRGSQPGSSWTYSDELVSTETRPDGTVVETYRRSHDGTRYNTRRNGTTCIVEESTDTQYVQTYDRVTSQKTVQTIEWLYRPIARDVSKWRKETTGCIEERKSTKILDYGNVDLAQNIDLDIDRVPESGNPDTQWRPRYHDVVRVRSIRTNGSGSISVPDVQTTQTFADTGNWWFSHCPAPARKLAPISASQLDSYLNSLQPEGATYHDIGMIWGGRLLSPTGIFAAENADTGNKVARRHLIFLTDGETEPFDIAYGAYGVDALDQRRWDPSMPDSLSATVEKRFAVACKEVKKRNITVWVIAFGTDVNATMVECAGDGFYFEAEDSDELNAAFDKIARSMGDLRISR